MQRVDRQDANLLLANSIHLYNYLTTAPINLLLPPLVGKTQKSKRVPAYMTKDYLLKLLNKSISCPTLPDVPEINVLQNIS